MKYFLLIIFFLPFFSLPGQPGSLDALKTLEGRDLQINETLGKLRQALVRLRAAEKANKPEELLPVYLEIGKIYEQEQFYSKALEYYLLAEEQAQKGNFESELLNVQTMRANAMLANGQVQEAHEIFLKILQKHEQANHYVSVIGTLQKLADACVAMRKFTQASEYYNKISDLAQTHNDVSSQVTALNNLGFAANHLWDYPSAVSYFSQAEILINSSKAVPKDLVYTNLGVAYHNMGDVPKSVEYLLKAEETGKEDSLQKSYIRHLIASIYLKNNDIYNALRYNEMAVKSAEKAKNLTTLCDAYDVASQIYQQLFEYDKALDFYKKHLALKDSLLREERHRQQTLENLHALLEQTESDIRQSLSEEEVRQLTLEQLRLNNVQMQLEADKQRLEADRQEKQLALLRREQEVKDANLRAAKLESERTQQALRLATQQLLAEKRGREIADLNRRHELDSLDAARQTAEQQQQIALLESQKQVNELKLRQQEQFKKSAYGIGILLAAILVLIFASWLYGRRLNSKLAMQNKQIESQKQEIDVERARSENLLLNVLPAGVAKELKETGTATPRHYSSATVVFTDFAKFTKIASTMPPTEVVRELNECFLAFDKIVERHGLEKIKTMGDSYMFAGGLPVPSQTHPQASVAAALEILAFMKNRNEQNTVEGRPAWQIRIGVHTGEVVAGVVGSKKFAYDVWGDTVNVASRMESNCPPGYVNISEATHRLVDGQFPCTFRGEVEVKNKGMMGMYLVG